MDAFKSAEISRMDTGGNKRWQDFFTANNPSGASFDECTIKERYDSEVGEEWKERLSAEVEDRTFDETAFKKQMEIMRQKKAQKEQERSTQNSRSGTPVAGRSISSQRRTESPAAGGPGKRGPGITAEQKAQNEAYFARMGDANASRPDGVPPSQGGKYGGFGSSVPVGQSNGQEGGLPGADEFQKDPVAAITKGFGWLGGMVSKQAKVVNESYIQPTAKNVSIPWISLIAHSSTPRLTFTL
jgi:ADP-ribosylation factor GTPase-activating protein 1